MTRCQQKTFHSFEKSFLGLIGGSGGGGGGGSDGGGGGVDALNLNFTSTSVAPSYTDYRTRA